MRLALLAALLAAAPAQAQMYKCVDARGVTQYADKPCPDRGGEEVDIRGQPPISGELKPHREDLKRAEQDLQRRQAQQDRERQADAKALETQQRRCTALRAELERANAVRNPSDTRTMRASPG